MTVIALPAHARWAWDARGDGRAVRVSTHAEVGLLNVSIWRDDICVGTVRLGPDDVATLVKGLTEGLAELATPIPVEPPREAGKIIELEERPRLLENRPAPVRPARVWRRAVDGFLAWASRSPGGGSG